MKISVGFIFLLSMALAGCATPYFDTWKISPNGTYAEPSWQITPRKEYSTPGEVMATATFATTVTLIEAKNACYIRWNYFGLDTHGATIQENQSFQQGQKMPAIATYYKKGKAYPVLFANGRQTHYYNTPLCYFSCTNLVTQTTGAAQFIIDPDTGKIFGATHVQQYNGEPIYHLVSSSCEFASEVKWFDIKYRILFGGISPTGDITIKLIQEASSVSPEKITFFTVPPIIKKYNIIVDNQRYVYSILAIEGNKVLIEGSGTNNQAPTLLYSGIGI